jgi:hypothetical protein
MRWAARAATTRSPAEPRDYAHHEQTNASAELARLDRFLGGQASSINKTRMELSQALSACILGFNEDLIMLMCSQGAVFEFKPWIVLAIILLKLWEYIP